GYRSAMYRLNELLDKPVGDPVSLPDAADIAETIINHQSVLDALFSRDPLSDQYADFLVEEMMSHAPELQQLSLAGEMIDRQKSMQIRKMYLPEVALIGNADQAFVREGVIRNPQLPVPPPPDDITWNLGLRVSIPLFEGGRKRAEIEKAAIGQEKIAWQRKDLLNKMEAGIRTNVQFLKASYRELELSEAAAKAAGENFQAVQDAYVQGMANAAQVADAQSVMVRTRTMAMGSKYQYLLDYVKTERLQGRFLFLEDDMEKSLYINRLLEGLRTE
ncbi:MAG TPA: TolC family protein, partial [Prolixibacteraceae bacterium]|nr:TolC family protein [Prolixibacteraceae bacterium]